LSDKFPPCEWGIQRKDSPGLGFRGPCLSFLHAPAAACLVKKAHDCQDRGCDDDHPFGPRGWPPKYGQNNYGHSQQEPAETEFHALPSFFIETHQFYIKIGLYSKVKI
jgi:hypothetical protein